MRWNYHTNTLADFKHHQLIGYFNKEYLKNNIIDRSIGSILNDTFERRNTIDYDDFATVTKSEVRKYYSDMKKFVKLVNKVSVDSVSETRLNLKTELISPSNFNL